METPTQLSSGSSKSPDSFPGRRSMLFLSCLEPPTSTGPPQGAVVMEKEELLSKNKIQAHAADIN